MNVGGGSFAGYRLDQLLATDTVSSIYRATPPRSRSRQGRPVALRVTHPLRTGDGPDVDAIATYLRRVSAAVKVTHRALTPIADAGETDDRVYVATALIEGDTLGQHIRRHRRLTPGDAVILLRDLARGLDRAHAAGIVHGAISPRTILIRWADGRPQSAMLDGFGIDTLLARQARLDRNRIDAPDVRYVAPEQLQGDAVDGRADQYALACALYHCIVGVEPFVRDTASATFGSHLFSVADTEPLATDPGLCAALTTGLEKRADRRHPSCTDLLVATGHVAEPGGPDGGRSATPRRRSRRSPPSADRPAVVWPDDDGARPSDPTDGAAARPRHPPGRSGAPSETPAPASAATAAGSVGEARVATTATSRSPLRAGGPHAPSRDATSTGDAADVAFAPPGAAPVHRWDVSSGRRPRRAAPSPHRRRRRTATARRWIGRRARGPVVSWPVATMMVLAGIVTTLTLVSVVRQDGLRAGGAAGGDPSQADSALVASGESPVAAGVRWQRALTDEPIDALHVADDTRVIAAAAHAVIALEADGGTSTWRRPIDVGVLTDVEVTEGTVALRAATFRALSVDDGTRLWEKGDIVAPVSSLTALDEVIYGIGPGRLTPELVALVAVSGEPLWFYDGGPRAIGDDASVVAAHGIVAMLDGNGLAVVDPEGPTSRTDDGRIALDGERWRADVPDPWVDPLAVLPDAVIVATRGGQVCAYDPADGALRWCVTVAGLADQAPSVVAEGDTVAVVLGSTVTALALESGARRWTYDAPRALRPVVTGTDRFVIVSDVGGRAYGLDIQRGFEAWRASGFGEITALAGTADALYAGTRNGVVVRLQPPLGGASS